MAKSTSACLDTSVLLHLLVGEPEKQAKKATQYPDTLGSVWNLDWSRLKPPLHMDVFSGFTSHQKYALLVT